MWLSPKSAAFHPPNERQAIGAGMGTLMEFEARAALNSQRRSSYTELPDTANLPIRAWACHRRDNQTEGDLVASAASQTVISAVPK